MRHPSRLAALALLGCFLVVAGGRARQQEFLERQKKIAAAVAAVDLVTKGKVKPAEVAAAHEQEFVAWTFKPNAKGGLGAGNGFEFRLYNLATRKALTEEKLQLEAPDLIRLAGVTVAVADIFAVYPLPKKTKANEPANWTKYNKEMKQASLEMIAAVKATKPADVKKAAIAVTDACLNCHREFRDNLD